MNVVVLHQSQSTIVYILFLDCTNQGVGDSLNSSLAAQLQQGLPALDMVFIFFTFLRGVFNSFKNAVFIFNKCGN